MHSPHCISSVRWLHCVEWWRRRRCLGLHGYFYRLLAWMAIPIGLLLLVVFAVLLNAYCGQRRKVGSAGEHASNPRKPKRQKSSEEEHGAGFHLADARAAMAGADTPPTLFQQMLPATLAVLFVLYPFVTKIAFDAFPCYSFEDGARGWLIADVSIECDTPDHAQVKAFAWGAIGAYPVGIWAFCFVLLFKASPAIIAGEQTALSKAIGFLYREYDVSCFWWELVS